MRIFKAGAKMQAVCASCQKGVGLYISFHLSLQTASFASNHALQDSE